MFSFAAMHRVRTHPVFAGYFAAVLPIFWPVLFWNLLRVADRMDEHGNCEVLILLHWWGAIEITHYGDPAPSPSAYRPIVPTRKAWDDPCWSRTVPAFLGVAASAVLFRCESAESGRPRNGLTNGACALTLHADTS